MSAKDAITSLNWLNDHIEKTAHNFRIVASKPFVSLTVLRRDGSYRRSQYSVGDTLRLTGVRQGKRNLIFSFETMGITTGPTAGPHTGCIVRAIEMEEPQARKILSGFTEWWEKMLGDDFDREVDAVERASRAILDEDEEAALEEARTKIPGWGEW